MMSRGTHAAVLFALCAAVLLPSFGRPYLVERFFLVAVGLLCVMLLIMRGQVLMEYCGKSAAPIFVLLCLLSIQYAAVYCYGLAAGYASGVRDLAEMPRYLFWMAFIALLLSMRARIRGDVVLRRVLIPSIYVVALLLLLYATSVPILSDLVRTLYAGTKTSMDLSTGFLRWAIPFENPNFLGLYLVWVLCAVLFSSSARGITLMLTLGLIFATGSRAAWVGTLLVVFIWLVWSLRARRLQAVLRIGSLTMGCAAVIVATAPIDLGSMVRVQLIPKAMQAGGLLHEPNIAFRVQQSVALVQETLAVRPLFGFGPGKYQVADIIDNQYVLWIARNGTVGLLLIIGLLVLLLWRPLSDYMRRGMGRAAARLTAFSVASAAILLTGSFLDNLRLLFIGLSIMLLVMANPAEESDARGG